MPRSVIVLLAVTNLLSLIAMGMDKLAARAHKGRVPETLLFTLAVLGGWPAGIVAMEAFRHKTLKKSFRLTYIALATLNLGLMVMVSASWGPQV